MTTEIFEYSEFVSLHLSGSSPATLAKQVEAVAGPSAPEKVATHFRDLCRRTGVAMWIVAIRHDNEVPLRHILVPVLRTTYMSLPEKDRLSTIVRVFIPSGSVQRAALLDQIRSAKYINEYKYGTIGVTACGTGLIYRTQFRERAKHLFMIGDEVLAKRLRSRKLGKPERPGSSQQTSEIGHRTAPDYQNKSQVVNNLRARDHEGESTIFPDRRSQEFRFQAAASVLLRNTQLAHLSQFLKDCSAVRFDADTRFLARELNIHNRWRIIFESPVTFSNRKVDLKWSGIDVQVTDEHLLIDYLPAPSSIAPENVCLRLQPQGTNRTRVTSIKEQLAIGLLVFIFANKKDLRTTSAELDLTLCRRWFEPYGLELSTSYKLISQPSSNAIHRVSSVRLNQQTKKPVQPRKPHAVRGHVRKVNGTEIRVRAHKRKK